MLIENLLIVRLAANGRKGDGAHNSHQGFIPLCVSVARLLNIYVSQRRIIISFRSDDDGDGGDEWPKVPH